MESQGSQQVDIGPYLKPDKSIPQSLDTFFVTHSDS
jgi:hypothetical protein